MYIEIIMLMMFMFIIQKMLSNDLKQYVILQRHIKYVK